MTARRSLSAGSADVELCRTGLLFDVPGARTAHVGFDSSEAFALRPAGATNRVRADRCRHDESLGVMHRVRSECAGRAHDFDLVTLDKVEHVDRSIRIVGGLGVEPVSAHFDVFELVQAGTLLEDTLFV